MPLVRRLEVGDETGEEAGAVGVAGGFVVVHKVAAAATEDFANGRGGEVAQLWRQVVCAEEGEDLLGRAENTAVKRVDEERTVLDVTADHEVPRKSHGFEFESQPLRNEQVNDAQRDRDALVALEHLVEEAVVGIGVV